MRFSIIFPFVLLIGGILGDVAEDLETIFSRRVEDIIKATHNPELANRWKIELRANGTWVDVDYTAGCPARRANWPAQDHFHRIITMASQLNHDPTDSELLAKISLALDFWFSNDFSHNDCINAGGRNGYNCPCDTPGLWNTNWYCQMILIPGLVGNACLLLKSNLTTTQFGNCTVQMSRSYERIDGDPNGSMGPMTGANMLDVASIAVSLALLRDDETLLADALSRYYNEARITPGQQDGIKIDGSFLQHDSQIYNGNYGAVFMRTLLKIFIQTEDTSFSPPESVQSVYLTLINGTEWFIYSKQPEGLISWQYSVIGRMVSHKYSNWRGIGLDLNELIAGTRTWANHGAFQEIVKRLTDLRENSNRAEALVGTRYFHAADYLVHRSENYTVALKMFSSRTTNSECNNGQNPFGFHLSDGTIYSYLKGNNAGGQEYTDVYGAWDWNLIPGTTVDYGATPLACNRVQFKGKENFVGGVVDAQAHSAIAVMNYTNPMTGSLHWGKTFIFFPNQYIVQFTNGMQAVAPIITTIDQSQLNGPVYIDGVAVDEPITTKPATMLWHNRICYVFLNPVLLKVDLTPRVANWSAIGISEGNETHTLFTATVQHPLDDSEGVYLTYSAYLDVDQSDCVPLRRALPFTNVLRSGNMYARAHARALAIVRGAYQGDLIILSFWSPGEFETGLTNISKVEASEPILLIFRRIDNSWKITVADPTQELTDVHLTVYVGGFQDPFEWVVDLPQGDLAGSGAIVEF